MKKSSNVKNINKTIPI